MAQQGGLDDNALKVLQLECIITSKDKEISLLREQLSQDQEVCPGPCCTPASPVFCSCRKPL
jgi:hypothetical protein